MKVEIRVTVWAGEDIHQLDPGAKVTRAPEAATLSTVSRHAQIPAGASRLYVRDHLQGIFRGVADTVPAAIDHELRKKGLK